MNNDVEIIIAVRGELLENLKRTVEAVVESAPVCIVYDGAEYPQAGVKPKRIIPNERIRVEIPWEIPKGPGQARHYGITTSVADIVVLTDAHMTFPGGWIKEITAYLMDDRRKKHLLCCRTQSLDQNFNSLEKEVLNGAFLAVKTKEVCSEYWAVSAKWNRGGKKSGYINAVMGACYAMRREWYDEIGQPLNILAAWGGDEEILSIATHVMGGKIRLMPIICGHVYMATHTGRIVTADEHDRIWSNRFAVVDVLPATKKQKKELLAWLRQTRRISGDLSHCFPAERQQAIKQLAAVLRRGKCTWSDLIKRGNARCLTDEEQVKCLGSVIKRDDEKRAAPPSAPGNDKTQIVVRPVETCARCNAQNSFVKIAGQRHFASFSLAYARCVRCGHKAQIRVYNLD